MPSGIILPCKLEKCWCVSPDLLYAGWAVSAEKVAAELERIRRGRGVPTSITVVNGSEFAGRAMDVWAFCHPDPAGSPIIRAAAAARPVAPKYSLIRQNKTSISAQRSPSFSFPVRTLPFFGHFSCERIDHIHRPDLGTGSHAVPAIAPKSSS